VNRKKRIDGRSRIGLDRALLALSGIGLDRALLALPEGLWRFLGSSLDSSRASWTQHFGFGFERSTT